MVKALTITPKVSQAYNGAKTAATKVLPQTASQIAEQTPAKSKATRGLVGTVIDVFKKIAKKISNPENAVSKISKNTNSMPHKDPAALVMKTTQG